MMVVSYMMTMLYHEVKRALDTHATQLAEFRPQYLIPTFSCFSAPYMELWAIGDPCIEHLKNWCYWVACETQSLMKYIVCTKVVCSMPSFSSKPDTKTYKKVLTTPYNGFEFVSVSSGFTLCFRYSLLFFLLLHHKFVPLLHLPHLLFLLLLLSPI